MNIPSTLLLRYFDLTSNNLQAIIDSPFCDEIPHSYDVNIDWHRNRIIKKQLVSLDEVLLDNAELNRDDMQVVLRQIGEGDFSCVAFDHDADNDQSKLVALIDIINDLARKAFSNSVLFVEWWFDHQNDQCRMLNGRDDEIDKSSILEYCALATSVVRIQSVQHFLESGTDLISVPSRGNDSKICELDSVNSRLEYVQTLIWRALGWDPHNASYQIEQLISNRNQSTPLTSDETVLDALTKYASNMTTAVNNATPFHSPDDGTTRVVNVSYSEKIVSVPLQGNSKNNEFVSLSAPISNAIHEQPSAQQRQQLDIAQKMTMLQQQIWSEFESLSSTEQTKTLEKAEIVQKEFFELVMNTPSGPDRVLLMQSMSDENQKLLVLRKLWSAQNTVAR